jgi:hypothetical protein
MYKADVHKLVTLAAAPNVAKSSTMALAQKNEIF